jgi:hypothetical protein
MILDRVANKILENLSLTGRVGLDHRQPLADNLRTGLGDQGRERPTDRIDNPTGTYTLTVQLPLTGLRITSEGIQ